MTPLVERIAKFDSDDYHTDEALTRALDLLKQARDELAKQAWIPFDRDVFDSSIWYAKGFSGVMYMTLLPTPPEIENE